MSRYNHVDFFQVTSAERALAAVATLVVVVLHVLVYVSLRDRLPCALVHHLHRAPQGCETGLLEPAFLINLCLDEDLLEVDQVGIDDPV